MTLLDYANDREYVVLFVAGVGYPTGMTTPLGHPDMDFADRRGLLELEGTIGEDGRWSWDGQGEPRDDRANSITAMTAYPDRKAWDRISAEYESEG